MKISIYIWGMEGLTRTDKKDISELVASNTRGLPNQALDAIASIMQKGYSMRQAKRMLGITRKVPIINRLKNKN